jgi:hypothetical protein
MASGLLLCGMLLVGCKDLVGDPQLPAGAEDPATYNTPTGALQLTATAKAYFEDALGGTNFTMQSGLLADELANANSQVGDSVDSRHLPEGYVGLPTDQVYRRLQALRAQARQARGVVTKYAPDLSPAVRGQLYAFEAYAEILLADLFCSGVPISTLDFEQNFTYQPGSTTAQLYQHALTLLDSARTLVTDSADLQTLVQVGQGRALLALGQYQAAADDVTTVPDHAAYRVRVSFSSSGFTHSAFTGGNLGSVQTMTVANREGVNGLAYLSSGDPRTASDPVTFLVNNVSVQIRYPNKYRPASPSTGADSTLFTVADGVEARLIQAEAALHAGATTTWLTTLNALRTDGNFTTTPSTNPDSVGVLDTTWSAGTGSVAGLSPLTDPGSAATRVDMMFAERAAWLFLTGHRLGDLRRLSRQYARNPQSIFPTGPYLSGLSGASSYGTDVNAPVPASERINPYFHGCLNREP